MPAWLEGNPFLLVRCSPLVSHPNGMLLSHVHDVSSSHNAETFGSAIPTQVAGFGLRPLQSGIYNQVEALLPSNAQENNMTKKGSGTRDKDADFAVLDEIRIGASLDDLLRPLDKTFFDGALVSSDDSVLDDLLPPLDNSVLDDLLPPRDDSVLDALLPPLDTSFLDGLLLPPNDIVPDDSVLEGIDEAMIRSDLRGPRRVGKRRPRRTGGTRKSLLGKLHGGLQR
jgi:hypothetical protein